MDKQIEEKLQSDLQAFFGDCFVEACVFYNETDYDDVLTVTMEEYAKAVANGKCYVYVFIDEAELSEDTIGSEYKYFSSVLWSYVKI